MSRQRCVSCNKFIKSGSTTCPHCGATQPEVNEDSQPNISTKSEVNAVDTENSTSSKSTDTKRILAGAAIILVVLLIFSVIFGPIFMTSKSPTLSTENESTSADSSDSSTDDSDSFESDSSNSYSYDSNDSNSTSYDSYDSDSSVFVDDEDTLGVELDDGSTVYQDGDGNYYYLNPDGSIEVTDGWGNVGIDTDLDGEFDSYSTDSGETWRDWD